MIRTRSKATCPFFYPPLGPRRGEPTKCLKGEFVGRAHNDRAARTDAEALPPACPIAIAFRFPIFPIGPSRPIRPDRPVRPIRAIRPNRSVPIRFVRERYLPHLLPKRSPRVARAGQAAIFPRLPPSPALSDAFLRLTIYREKRKRINFPQRLLSREEAALSRGRGRAGRGGGRLRLFSRLKAPLRGDRSRYAMRNAAPPEMLEALGKLRTKPDKTRRV